MCKFGAQNVSSGIVLGLSAKSGPWGSQISDLAKVRITFAMARKTVTASFGRQPDGSRG